MTNRVESLVDYGTSAIAGGASGFCCALLVASPVAPIAAGGAGFLGVLALMKRVGSASRDLPLPRLAPIPLPEFEDVEELLLDEPEELVLEIEAPMAVSEAQARIASAFEALGPSRDEEPLLLDDPLPSERTSNRVVALFGGDYDPAADPSALKARIDEHLAARGDARPPASGMELVPDASEALAAALKGLGRDKA